MNSFLYFKQKFLYLEKHSMVSHFCERWRTVEQFSDQRSNTRGLVGWWVIDFISAFAFPHNWIVSTYWSAGALQLWSDGALHRCTWIAPLTFIITWRRPRTNSGQCNFASTLSRPLHLPTTVFIIQVCTNIFNPILFYLKYYRKHGFRNEWLQRKQSKNVPTNRGFVHH